jgi:hypothetical protein
VIIGGNYGSKGRTKGKEVYLYKVNLNTIRRGGP